MDKVPQATHGRPRAAVKKGGTNRLLRAYDKARVGKKSKEEIVQEKAIREKDRSQKLQAKKERQRKMNKRTKKGQPVMKNRMEIMLEKIMTDKETYQTG